MTFDEMLLSVHPAGDQGPGQRRLSPSDFPEGSAGAWGGSSNVDPRGRWSLLLQLPTASKYAGRVRGTARVSARTQAVEGEARGSAYLTRKPSGLGARRCTARSYAPSAQRTCRDWAAAPTALRPRPAPAQGPAPYAEARTLPPPARPWSERARSQRRVQLVTLASP